MGRLGGVNKIRQWQVTPHQGRAKTCHNGCRQTRWMNDFREGIVCVVRVTEGRNSGGK